MTSATFSEKIYCLIFYFWYFANQGTCTGEHGIGLGKKKYLIDQFGPDALNLMKAIKVLMDPNNILNPGKIF